MQIRNVSLFVKVMGKGYPILLMRGGSAMWSGYAQMADTALASGQDIRIIVGSVLWFPVWGAALALATLGCYYRRRGPCSVCGRGA